MRAAVPLRWTVPLLFILTFSDTHEVEVPTGSTGVQPAGTEYD
jgi:hypothetical protein